MKKVCIFLEVFLLLILKLLNLWIFKYFQANVILKDSLELHSLKAGNLEVLPYFCCVQKDFVSFHLHGGLIRVY
jgi:hypothetical protein